MGTNFYAVLPVRNRKLINEEINKLINLAKDEDDFSLVKEQLNHINNVINANYTEIHLGKRSAGWAFLWDTNELKYYEPSLESIRKFIQDSKATIINEYREIFSWDEFLAEIKYCLHPSTEPLTKEKIKEKYGDSDYMKKFINGDVPFYEYCTGYTYKLMYPEDCSYSTYNSSYNSSMFKTFAKEVYYYDFISKDNLRFSLFTDFC